MSEEVKYVYYEGPKDELVRDLKTDGEDMALELEAWSGGEWVNYYGSISDLVAIDADEAEKIMGKESPESPIRRTSFDAVRQLSN